MSIIKESINLDKSNLDYIINSLGKTIDVEFIIECLNSIDLNVFKDYKLHGVTHAINVCILALMLSNQFNLTDTEKKILVDAALLHDIGRMDDYSDYNHCKIGAILASNILENQFFYKTSDNIRLVMLLIEGHNNIFDITLFQKYNIPRTDRIVILQKVLMDSDILDRVRLGSLAGFNPSKLNFDSSINLLDIAYMLNRSSIASTILKGCDYDDRVSKDYI